LILPEFLNVLSEAFRDFPFSSQRNNGMYLEVKQSCHIARPLELFINRAIVLRDKSWLIEGEAN
jgi:hypothetical protein